MSESHEEADVPTTDEVTGDVTDAEFVAVGVTDGVSGIVLTDSSVDGTDVSSALVTDGVYALLVADFSSVDLALEAYHQLQEEVEASRLKLEGAVVLKKEVGEFVKVQTATDRRTGRWAGLGAVAGAAIGVLFPPSILAGAVVAGGLGAGIGRLRHMHYRKEIAEQLEEAIAPGHSGLVLLVSDPTAVKLREALVKADRIVQKAVDQAFVDEVKAEAADQEKAVKG